MRSVGKPRKSTSPGPGHPTPARIKAINRAILIAARAEFVSSPGAPPMHELRRVRHEVGHRHIVQVMVQDIIDGSREQSIQPRSAMRVAEMLIAMLYGWWRMRQDTGSVKREEALSYADHAVDSLFEGRSAWSGAPSAS